MRWNIIFGSPREDLSDYENAAALAKKITHLRPPAAWARIRLDRYSPNYRNWREQGFTAIRPMGAYRHLYPFPDEELGRLATIFAYNRPEEAAWRAATAPLLEIVTSAKGRYFMEAPDLRFVLVVDASTCVVKSISEIDADGHEIQALILGTQWISAASQDGSATTLVFTAKKDQEGKFPVQAVIIPGS